MAAHLYEDGKHIAFALIQRTYLADYCCCRKGQGNFK
jgi:hypothetical protein